MSCGGCGQKIATTVTTFLQGKMREAASKRKIHVRLRYRASFLSKITGLVGVKCNLLSHLSGISTHTEHHGVITKD
jgi:hypothetical protein